MGKYTGLCIGGFLAGQVRESDCPDFQTYVPERSLIDISEGLPETHMKVHKEAYYYTTFTANQGKTYYHLWCHSSLEDDNAILKELLNGYRPITEKDKIY